MQGGPSPDEVLQFTNACTEFLCPLEANIYEIMFGSFRVRDLDSGVVLFELDRIPEPQTEETRFIQYTFPPEFLNLRTIGTMLLFSIGSQPLQNLRMIERHYLNGELLRSFDFSIGFCMPNTTNTWEHMYQLPELSEETKVNIISNPYATKSDSFFFVDDSLVMHTRAEYDYSGPSLF